MIYLSFLCMNSLLYSSCILKKNSWWERVSSLETFSLSFYQLSFQSDDDSNLLYWVKKYNLLWLKMYGSELNMYKHIRNVLQTLCVPLMQVHSLYKMYMNSNLYISFTLHKTVILLFSYLFRSGIPNNKFIYNNKPCRLESLVHWRHGHFLPLTASLSQLPLEKCIGYSENKTHSTQYSMICIITGWQ